MKKRVWQAASLFIVLTLVGVIYIVWNRGYEANPDSLESSDLKYSDFSNDRGVGFFYPAENAVVSGISKIYGLAYTGEGWLEEDKGIAKVEVDFGGQQRMEARLYVKNRYWIRTFDTAAFKNGPLLIKVTAYDKDGNIVRSAASTVIVDNSKSVVQSRLYAAPDGKADNKGTMDEPWDLQTGVKKMNPGDVLFLKGGVYKQDLIIGKSGTADLPITIMNVPGEKVELEGKSISIGYEREHIRIMGIDQHGLRQNGNGAELADGVKYIEFWDCSFNDNTHPYETSEPSKTLGFGTGFMSDITYTNDPERNRQFITISHSEAKYNDVDGFHLSSINHGRFQFLEAAWNPNHKTKDVFQYKHANGFVNKNSANMGWGTDSEDNVYLFDYAHHNGQDGWDLRSPHAYLFGCISSDTAQAGNNFGGVGMKFWEYDYKVYNSVNFRNNLIDQTGGGMIGGNNVQIYNTLFYDTKQFAIDNAESGSKIHASNNIFMDYVRSFSTNVKTNNTIYYGDGEIPIVGSNKILEDPKFLNPDAGNFFLKADSPALSKGNLSGVTFVVDGVDYAEWDGLGRPRVGKTEIGPYTRYPGPDAAEYAAPALDSRASDSEAVSSKGEGVDDAASRIAVKSGAIQLDGKLDDWKDVAAYDFQTHTDGGPLRRNHRISMVWDGKDKLYLYGTIMEDKDTIAANEAQDSPSWWNDDVFEVFLTDKLPATEAENKTSTKHYGINAKHLFKAKELQHDAEAAILPALDKEWSFEMMISLDESMVKAVESGAPLYAKFGVELNSIGEYSLLWHSEEGFWGTENFQELHFE